MMGCFDRALYLSTSHNPPAHTYVQDEPTDLSTWAQLLEASYAWRIENVPPDFANASAANNSRGSSCRGARRMNSRAASMSLSRCTLYTWHMQTSKFT